MVPRRELLFFWREILSKMMQLTIANRSTGSFPVVSNKRLNLLVLILLSQLSACYRDKAGRVTPVLPPTLENYTKINGSSKEDILGVKFTQLPSAWGSSNGKAYWWSKWEKKEPGWWELEENTDAQGPKVARNMQQAQEKNQNFTSLRKHHLLE